MATWRIITINSWKYDRVAWALELKWAISHVWCEKLKIVVVPIDPIINREVYVPFWIITNKVQSIYCWIWALHQADGFGIGQVNLAVLESTLVDLVRVHPISNIQLMQIWVTMLIATDVPFVVQFISQPAWLKKKRSSLVQLMQMQNWTWQYWLILIQAGRPNSIW